MHIFHVITTLEKGGAESHLVDLCRALAARGVRLTVAYIKGQGYWVPELNAVGAETIHLGSRGNFGVSAVAKLAKAIKRVKPDVVHAHMPPAELYCTLAMHVARAPAYMISKHVDRHPFYPGPASRWLERQCARRAKVILCISQAVNDYFQGIWPRSLAEKLVTVRYGLTPLPNEEELTDKSAALRHDWGVAPDEIVFGIAARFVEQKAIDTLIDAFALLVGKTGRRVRLVLVGQGPLESDFRAQVKRLGLGENVIFAGFRADIPVVMRAFDVFVLSSIFEGFGLVLLEAMEASTPIVASGVSAIPEIVVDGETGILVPPRNAKALARAMEQTLDARVREAMGSAGHSRMIDHFSVDAMADATLALYDRVRPGAPDASDMSEPR